MKARTKVSPLYYERVIAIVKKTKSQLRMANKFWSEAESMNAPLWAENAKLRNEIASAKHEASEAIHRANKLQERLDMIAVATNQCES